MPTFPALKNFLGPGKSLGKNCLAKWGYCLKIFKVNNKKNNVTTMAFVLLGT